MKDEKSFTAVVVGEDRSKASSLTPWRSDELGVGNKILAFAEYREYGGELFGDLVPWKEAGKLDTWTSSGDGQLCSEKFKTSFSLWVSDCQLNECCWCGDKKIQGNLWMGRTMNGTENMLLTWASSSKKRVFRPSIKKENLVRVRASKDETVRFMFTATVAMTHRPLLHIALS